MTYCGERTYTLVGGSGFISQSFFRPRELTLYTTQKKYIGYHDDVYMHVELADWSKQGNITIDIPIPILIESCIPQDITYAHKS